MIDRTPIVPNLAVQNLQSHLLQGLQSKDLEAELNIRQTTLGFVEIQAITEHFEGKEPIEREAYIDNILEAIGLNLGQHPISNYSLLTPQEKKEQQPDKMVQLPLWSDILMAPSPEYRAIIEEGNQKRPQVVTFYSFKGGVGRSTALGIVAVLLANRNRRVVVIDFDLEAPGISILLNPEDLDKNGEGCCGVLDYLHQRHLTPGENIPSIEDCISQIDLSSRGDLFLISAGEYNADYVHRLAELDRRVLQSFYMGKTNPVEQLMDDIVTTLDPDVILIDSRPGFNDTGAVALLDLADTGIICFSPTDQSFGGLQWVIQAARKQFDSQGKPDLRFLLTPMPAVTEDQLNALINRVEDWITDYWGLPDGMKIEEMYYKIFYNPNMAVLSSLLKVPRSLLNDYSSIADTIDASLPEHRNLISREARGSYKDILRELEFQPATAQELDANNIPNIFQRTENFPKFLSDRIRLIRGAKGTGKSILFRLFVEQPRKAQELAKADIDLINSRFFPGHGEPRLGPSILSSESFQDYEKEVGEDCWAALWINYALLQLCVQLPELAHLPGFNNELSKLVQQVQENLPIQRQIISWLVQGAQSSFRFSQANDELKTIDRWLNERDLDVWLLYDELDVGFGFGASSYARRKRALEALLGWWLTSGTGLERIIPKIFLREDIWNQLNFENKGYYRSGRSLELSWDEADLWRLVLRQSLKSSDSLRLALAKEQGISLDRLETTGLETLRQALYPLWGERMGRGKKAYTYNWIRTRIADSNGVCFPRSLILLLQQAVQMEKEFKTEYGAEVVIRPRSLIEAYPYVSRQRVEEVRNEYRELEEPLNQLDGERSPIDEDRLTSIWRVETSELSSRIKEMLDAGIFKERSRPKDPPPRTYGIAELYLYGLSMTRKGQR
jgi:MinD-like ATPase involved in chromosome partitioning or flagellar assembly